MWPVVGFPDAFAFLARWNGDSVPLPAVGGVAKSVVCHILRTDDFSILDKVKQGVPPPPSTGDCPVGKQLALYLQPPIDGLDGTWHFTHVAEGLFVSMYEAPVRDIVHPSPTTTLELHGSYAVRRLSWPAFVCPSDPEGECVSWHPRNPEATGFYCTDEAALECFQQDYGTELFIIDAVKGFASRLGPYERQARPEVFAQSASILVKTPTCSQTVRPDKAVIDQRE